MSNEVGRSLHSAEVYVQALNAPADPAGVGHPIRDQTVPYDAPMPFLLYLLVRVLARLLLPVCAEAAGPPADHDVRSWCDIQLSPCIADSALRIAVTPGKG